MDRLSKLLFGIDKTMKILEIGPGYNPAIRKADGWNVWTIDHASREELQQKYSAMFADAGLDTDVSGMSDIDFISCAQSLADSIPDVHRGTFDACIASHVIEHYPDIIRFFESAAMLLRHGGILSLAIPDKRYLFDAFRPHSTTGEALRAHHEKRLRHSKQTVFDSEAYFVTSSFGMTWGPAYVPEYLRLRHSLSKAKEAFDVYSEDTIFPYTDFHAWVFTPSSFHLLVNELSFLGLIDFKVHSTFPTEGCEFIISLRKGREPPKSEEAFQQERLKLLIETVLDAREQAEQLLSMSEIIDADPARQTESSPTLPFSEKGRSRKSSRATRVATWPIRAARRVRKRIVRTLRSRSTPAH